MSIYKKFSQNPLDNKKDYRQLVLDLFEPIIPYYSEGKARVDFNNGGAHFPMVSSHLEGFARPLWALAPLISDNPDFIHWEIIKQGLINGTDPNHSEYWGETKDTFQHSVEMASIGILMALLPEKLYNDFDNKQQSNIANWLSTIQYHKMPQNNWLFFTILSQIGLEKMKRSELVDYHLKQQYLDKLDSWYIGDGYYGDGIPRTIDHYGGFAMHFYGLLYSYLKKDELDDPYVKIFKHRGLLFAKHFKYWFNNRGETIAIGRSLTYRFACCGFWGALALVSDDPKIISTAKNIWDKHIKSWQNKPIFTNDGILTRGYYYPNLAMCETYNSPTSPYWAMKAFFPILLKQEHPFWQTKATEIKFKNKLMPSPQTNNIIQHVDGDNIIHYNSPVHTWLQIDKYNKFAYSTNFGFCVDSLKYASLYIFGDNILTFSFDNGISWVMRNKNISSNIVDEHTITSHWQANDNVSVETTISILPEHNCHVRTHNINLKQDAIIAETGFAIDNWYIEEQINNIDNYGINIIGGNGNSLLYDISQFRNIDSKQIVNSNVNTPRCIVPNLTASLLKGNHTIKTLVYAHPQNKTLSSIQDIIKQFK